MSSPAGSTVTFRRAPADFGRGAVERFARVLQAEVTKGRSFDCLIAGDAELRRLNRQFRGQDYATDVLSFPAGPLPNGHGSAGAGHGSAGAGRGSAGLSLGDIAISVARARSQARQYGHTPEQEIQILLLHGVLHLLGMDHETDRGRMARAEERWRARLGLPHGLIERVGFIERVRS
jgi:probable rRNA maturation factor